MRAWEAIMTRWCRRNGSLGGATKLEVPCERLWIGSRMHHLTIYVYMYSYVRMVIQI